MSEATIIDEHLRGVLSGQRAGLARAITLVESARAEDRATAEGLIEKLLPKTGKARRIGISGVPGVGKSTFIEQLGLLLIAKGHKVAVLAVDPSSTVSGGSILGDKTRMPRLAVDPNAFIRPSPASGTLGGVAKKTREAIAIVEAAGYDVVLVETVGVGQSEVTVAGMVDSFLLLLLPGGGDELQGIKRGVVELCDVVVVNKADGDSLPSAQRAQAEYSAALRILRGTESWLPPVLLASALHGTGLAEVWGALDDHQTAGRASGDFEARRRAQRVAWLRSLIESRLFSRFEDHPAVRAELARLEAEVADSKLSAPRAAELALSLFSQ